MDRDQNPKKDDIASRLLSRVGSVFRRSGRRTKSTVGVGEQPTVPKTSVPASASPAPQPSQQPQSSTSAPTTEANNRAQDVAPVIHWSEIQQERARILFAKYGLTLEASEWMTPQNLEVRRVDKPIRMRIRRTCHRCQTTFGPDKVCGNCQHVRCKQCPRYPPARTKEEKEARALAKAQAKADPSSPVAGAGTDSAKAQKQALHTMSTQAGGHDLAYKNPKQRAGRLCHRCRTPFPGNYTLCENCGHNRCQMCPSDPSHWQRHTEEYSAGENAPFDPPLRVWKKPRMRVRYHCQKCDTQYNHGVTICVNCGQEKGSESRRDPPKKTKPPIDAEVLKRVQERLQGLHLEVIQVNDT